MTSPFPNPSHASRPAQPELADDSGVADPWKSGLAFSPMLGPTLSAVGLGLIALFAIAVCSQVLPPRLLVSAWQLRAASVLVETGPFALIGLALLQLGAWFDPSHERLQLRWHRLGRLGVVAALGFLLLIPLQAVAAYLSLQTAANAQSRQEWQLERNFSALREQISAAASFPDLQRRLAGLQAPDLAVQADVLRQPLPEQKRALLRSADQLEQNLRRNLTRARAPERTRALLQGIASGMVSALVLALGFAAATPLWEGPELSLLQAWRWSLGLRRQRRRGPLRLERKKDADEFLRRCGFEDESSSAPAPHREDDSH